MFQLNFMTDALIIAYLDQRSHQTWRQILSVFAYKFAKKKTQNLNLRFRYVEQMILQESTKVLKTRGLLFKLSLVLTRR